METKTLHLALGILGAALLVCLVGCIVFGLQRPPAEIPDVLAATPGAIVTGILGLLVTTRSSNSAESSHAHDDFEDGEV